VSNSSATGAAARTNDFVEPPPEALPQQAQAETSVSLVERLVGASIFSKPKVPKSATVTLPPMPATLRPSSFMDADEELRVEIISLDVVDVCLTF
jgi:hypothetical protein